MNDWSGEKHKAQRSGVKDALISTAWHLSALPVESWSMDAGVMALQNVRSKPVEWLSASSRPNMTIQSFLNVHFRKFWICLNSSNIVDMIILNTKEDMLRNVSIDYVLTMGVNVFQ